METSKSHPAEIGPLHPGNSLYREYRSRTARQSITMALLLLVLFLVPNLASSSVFQVSNFTELQNAIGSAADGDTVELTADISMEGSLSMQGNIEITSAGGAMYHLDFGNGGITSSSTLFSNLVLQNGGFEIQGGSPQQFKFKRCVFKSLSGRWPWITAYVPSNVYFFPFWLESCTFEDYHDPNAIFRETPDVTPQIYSMKPKTFRFITSCSRGEFAAGSYKSTFGWGLYEKGLGRQGLGLFSADLIDSDNCRICPEGLLNIGVGCDYPSNFGDGLALLPCSRFWYQPKWSSPCGAFRILAIFFLCVFGVISLYIHWLLYKLVRDLFKSVPAEESPGFSSEPANPTLPPLEGGWKKYKLNILVLFAQLDLAGDTLYLSFGVFGASLLEVLGLLFYFLPALAFMVAHRTIVLRHLKLLLHPILWTCPASWTYPPWKVFHYEAWDELYKVVLGSMGVLIEAIKWVGWWSIWAMRWAIWFCLFSWAIVPVTFVYFMAVFLFVSSKLMCVVSYAEAFVNFGLDEAEKRRLSPEEANRMFNGSLFSELVMDTIPQLALSITNGVLLKTVDGLFAFQVVSSSLVVCNEVYPFVYGALRHRSLVKSFEKREHALLELQVTPVIGHGGDSSDNAVDDDQIELEKVGPVSQVESAHAGQTDEHLVSLMAQIRNLKRECEGRFRVYDKYGERLDEHGERLDEHGERFDEHGERFDEHGERLHGLDMEMKEVRSEVAPLLSGL